MILITDDLLSKAAYEVDMAILDMLPEPSECDHVFSVSFEHKIKKLIRKAKYFVAYKVLKRVACVFIVLILSACMFVAFNPNARAAVVDWVKAKVDDFYHYFFAGEIEADETVISDPTEEIVSTVGTDATETTTVAGDMKKYFLSWVPDGYSLLTSHEAENKLTFVYVDASGQMMQFIYMHGSDNFTLGLGGGEYEQKDVAVGPTQAELLLATTSEHSNAIVWKSIDGNTMFVISAFAEEDDLIKMAESLAVDEKSE